MRPGALTALLREIAVAPEKERDGAWEAVLQPGASVGRFELVREVGRGGFGVVWEARDRELGRSVAFKAVSAGSALSAREERLLQEAEAAAQLSHPNIVTLFDLGRAEQGPYLVLELLEGETLEARLSRGPLPVAEAVRIATEVARGLAHAHAKGVVHRDLKPANVFLCGDGRVKVLDFGLARAFGRRKADGGTSGYMAPEQAEGAPEDERTDVWALGALLYEMLAGKQPYPGGAPKGQAAALEVPGAPALGALVGRMLSPRPVDRPRDGAANLAELERVGRQVDPGAETGPVRTRRRSGLRLAWLVAAGVAIGAALAFAVQRHRAGVPAPGPDGRIAVAVADIANETGERELDVLSGLLITSLEQSQALAVMTQARVLDLAVRGGRKEASRVDETLGREVGRTHGVRALLLPAIRKLGATYSLEIRAIDPTADRHLFTLSDRVTKKEALLDLLDRLSERTRTELGEGKAEVAKASVQLGSAMTRSVEAYQRYVTGRDALERDANRAVALAEFEEALRLDPDFAPAHSDLADLLEDYGRPDLAAPHWRATESNVERLPAKERHVLLLRRAYATPAAKSWSRDETRRLAEEAVVRFPADKHVLADAAGAFDFLALGEQRDAALRRALDLDPGHWIAAWRLSRRLGERTEEALAVARRAVATRRSAANLTLLAEVLHAAGAGEEAAATAREALEGEGGRTSLVAAQACFVLYQSGADAECQAIWERMRSEGRNPLERDKASAKLVESLFVRGRVREALRALRALDEPRRGEPGRLTFMLTIGHHRKLAPPEALEQARRIPNPMGRRNFLSWVGAKGEAERVDAELRDRSAWGGTAQRIYDAVRLADQARFAEAAELMRTAYDDAQAFNAPTYSWSRASFVAEALLADGRPEEALRVQPPTLPCRCRDPVDHAASYPPFALVRARALEQLGRRADAVGELDGVIAFWKDADADLPLLLEARALKRRQERGAAARGGGP